jgi:hypothetical protein
VKSSHADFLYSSVLPVPIRSELTAHGSCYIATERTSTYSKHISRDRYPANVLARRMDLQKTQLPLLLRVGPCLQSCCLATRWQNPLHYYQLSTSSPVLSRFKPLGAIRSLTANPTAFFQVSQRLFFPDVCILLFHQAACYILTFPCGLYTAFCIP